jgi:hypothetical protein
MIHNVHPQPIVGQEESYNQKKRKEKMRIQQHDRQLSEMSLDFDLWKTCLPDFALE